MKRILKSNLLSYILCCGLLITVMYTVSTLSSQAATINAIATSTKEACRSSDISATSNESNYCTIPIMNKTINKYAIKISAFKNDMAESVKDLSSIKFIKETCIKAQNGIVQLKAVNKNQEMLLMGLFVILLFAQIYYKTNTLKAIQKINKVFVRPINIIKHKIHIFNLTVLKLIQDEEIQEIHVNLKKLLTEKSKIKFYNNKSLLMKLLVVKMSMQVKIIYIDSMILRAKEEKSIESRGYSFKPCKLENSS